MAQHRNNVWVGLTLGAMALLVTVFAWTAWQGGEASGDAVRTAAEAVPDLRPRLPESPKLPTPIPIPK